MDIERFWEIIETAGGASCEDRAAAVSANLVQLGRDETAEFVRLFDDTLDQLYTWDLWAVAYIVQGGCSDDGFEYFRGWVISQGRRAHALALSDLLLLASRSTRTARTKSANAKTSCMQDARPIRNSPASTGLIAQLRSSTRPAASRGTRGSSSGDSPPSGSGGVRAVGGQPAMTARRSPAPGPGEALALGRCSRRRSTSVPAP